MKLLFTLLGLSLALAAAMPAEAASGLSPAERDAIVQTVTKAAAAELKLGPDALRLTPDQIKHSGDWVFLTAHMRDAADRRFDYAGTDLYEAAKVGAVSSLCAALLQRKDGGWKLIEIAVGPTDVAWETWSATHKAPASLFSSAGDAERTTAAPVASAAAAVPAALQGRWAPVSRVLESAGPLTLGARTLHWSICGSAERAIEPQVTDGGQQVLIALAAAGAAPCSFHDVPVTHLRLKPLVGHVCEWLEVTLYQNAQQLAEPEPAATWGVLSNQRCSAQAP